MQKKEASSKLKQKKSGTKINNRMTKAMTAKKQTQSTKKKGKNSHDIYSVWIDKIKNISASTLFKIGYALFYLYFIILIANYANAIYYLENKVITNSIVIIMILTLTPYGLWLFSTKEIHFNYHNRKKSNFKLVLISSVLTIIQPVIYLSHRFIVSNIMKIPITQNMTKDMVVSLARIGMVIPLVICIALIAPPLYKWITSMEVEGKIENFKIKHIIDFRKNKAYRYDLKIFRDLKTGKLVTIKEDDRLVHTFINGQSGTGKTSSTMIPGICNDLNQKIINRQKREAELLAMVKANEAYVVGPVSKVDEYNVRPKKKYIKKYKKIYKNYPDCGMTIMAPNNAMNNTIIELCEARGLDVNVVDPSQTVYKQRHAKPKGLENFYIPLGLPENERIIRILEQAIAFSETLIATNEQNGQGEQYFRDISTSVTVNIAIICMLAANIEGRQTDINEIHHCISNFGELKSKVEIIEEEFGIQVQINEISSGKKGSKFSAEELLEKTKKSKLNDKGTVYGNGKDNPYYSMLVYVKKELLGSGAEKMEDQARGLRNLLDKILMDPRYLRILSTSHENAINFNEILSKNQITVVNTALEYGSQVSTALGILFLLNMQLAVLRRPADNRSFHFIWVDEAAQYVHQVYENMYALYRQYGVATTLALQTLSQMNKTRATEYLKNIVLGAGLQILFGRVSAEEMELYSKLAGSVSENIVQKTETKTSLFMTNVSQNESERIMPSLKNNLEGSQIRMRDFQEVSIFRIDDGRVLPGFLARCNFIDAAELKKRTILRVNFAKYIKKKKTEVVLTDKGQSYVEKQQAFIDERKGKVSIKTSHLEKNYKKEELQETIELFRPDNIEPYVIEVAESINNNESAGAKQEQQAISKGNGNNLNDSSKESVKEIEKIKQKDEPPAEDTEELKEQPENEMEEKYVFGNLFSEVLAEEEFWD